MPLPNNAVLPRPRPPPPPSAHRRDLTKRGAARLKGEYNAPSVQEARYDTTPLRHYAAMLRYGGTL